MSGEECEFGVHGGVNKGESLLAEQHLRALCGEACVCELGGHGGVNNSCGQRDLRLSSTGEGVGESVCV